MFSRRLSCASLVAVILLILSTNSPASSSLCQLIGVTSDYPHEAPSNQPIQVKTTVAGSCASDGEDYFSVRVDLLDKLTNSTIASNSAPVGYNAKNFSVTIENSAVTPQLNVTWPLEIDVYVIESGGVMGKYILTIDNATIQVGTVPMAEIQVTPGSLIPVVLLAAVLMLRLSSSDRRRERKTRIQ